MPKPAEIVAALGDVSAIESYATLRAEMVDLFTSLADWMKDRNDERQAQIFRKMAATVEMIPYDMLAEFGHNYNPVLISAVLIVQVFHADAPDYAMLTIWYSPCWTSCGASTSIILIRKRLSRSLKSSLNPWDGRTRTLRPIGKTRAAARRSSCRGGDEVRGDGAGRVALASARAARRVVMLAVQAPDCR